MRAQTKWYGIERRPPIKTLATDALSGFRLDQTNG